MATCGLRERKKRRTEASIVEAAFTLFNERGFNSSTMEEVAERAEAAVGTIYNYFDSKSHIVVAVLHNETEKYAQRAVVKAENSSKITLKRLHAYSDAYLGDFVSYDKSLWCEMFSGLFKDSVRAAKLFGENSSVLGHISRLMTHNKSKERQQPLINNDTAFVLHSSIITTVLSYITDPDMGIEKAQKAAREMSSCIIKKECG